MSAPVISAGSCEGVALFLASKGSIAGQARDTRQLGIQVCHLACEYSFVGSYFHTCDHLMMTGICSRCLKKANPLTYCTVSEVVLPQSIAIRLEAKHESPENDHLHRCQHTATYRLPVSSLRDQQTPHRLQLTSPYWRSAKAYQYVWPPPPTQP